MDLDLHQMVLFSLFVFRFCVSLVGVVPHITLIPYLTADRAVENQ